MIMYVLMSMIFDGSLFKTRMPFLKMSNDEEQANTAVYDPVRVIRPPSQSQSQSSQPPPPSQPPPARNMRSEVRELKEQVREHQAMLQAILDSMGRAAVSLDWRNAHSSFVNSANNNYNSGGSLGSAAFKLYLFF
jgi:hypothetical protein